MEASRSGVRISIVPPPWQRVLVTGAGGFVGSHLCEALTGLGVEVIGLEGFVPSYPRRYKEHNLERLLADRRFTLVQADLRTDDLAPHLDGVDVVINEAAFPGLPRSWSDVQSYVDCNLTGLSRLVDASRAAGVRRFVQASSSAVYGATACGDEQAPTRPISPYGVTELAAENLLLAHVHVHGFPAVILRYFSIYGPRQRPDMAYHTMIEQLRHDLPLHVFGDGRQSRSNTYIDDGVRGTLDAIDGGSIGEVYNLGGGVEMELLEAVELLAAALGVRPQVRHEPARIGDQRRTHADISKATEAFGFRPVVDPESGLRQQVNWHTTELAALAEPRLPVPA